jgi:hypothetical protein
VVERFRRVTFDRLDYQATIEDPNVFAKPWMVHRTPAAPDGPGTGGRIHLREQPRLFRAVQKVTGR